MIKVLYYRQLPFRLLFKNCLEIYRNSQLYSTIRLGTSALKHSRFSEFMGLASQLRKLQKEQEKNEKNQVRHNISMIIIGFAVLFCGAIFISSDASIRLKYFVITRKMQLSFYKQKNKRREIYQEILTQVQSFLKNNPYDYLGIIGMLNDVLNEAGKNHENQIIQNAFANIYSYILSRNLAAKSNKQFLQGVSLLLQHCYANNRIIYHQNLQQALLEEGSIKQMYLALKCLKSDEIISQSQRQKIRKNLSNQIDKNSKYFCTIFEKIKQEQLPQFSFKKSQILYWQTFIQQKLNIQKL